MKKLFLYLLVAVVISCVGGVVVSCEKNNPRDELNPGEVQDQALKDCTSPKRFG